jgi:hypothetical protein
MDYDRHSRNRTFAARLKDCLRYSLLCAALASFAGCGASVTPAGIAGADPHGSWMSAEAKARSLLYVSDDANGDVDVFTYPFGKLVGRLAGFLQPAGICTDAAGDVWIVDAASSKLFEYGHGDKTPIATLSDPNASALLACSVDPTTGNLAVTDFGNASGAGSILIYSDAKGNPSKYRNAQLQAVYFCGYDDLGNLFVDGLDPNGAFEFLELPRGSGVLQHITLNGSIFFPGGVAWDGKYVTIGDQEYQGGHHSAIFQVAISASLGSIVGVTSLDSSCDVLQYSIPKLGKGRRNPQGSKVVAPDACLNAVAIYNYPAGGVPVKTLGNLEYPVGSAVSK